jgi:hypothetical protein
MLLPCCPLPLLCPFAAALSLCAALLRCAHHPDLDRHTHAKRRLFILKQVYS